MKSKFLKIAVLMCVITLCIPAAKAGMWDELWAAVTSRGSHPAVKTFYLQPHENMENVDYLEYQDYVNSLKIRLEELGYIETSKEDAALLIKMGYYISQKETVSTSSSTRTHNISKTSYNINSTKSANSTTNASVIGFSDMAIGSSSKNATTNSKTQIQGQTFSYGGSGTTTTVETGIPCFLRLEAINIESNIPQWTLDMEVIVDDKSRFPTIFPWMCLMSKWYIGKSFSGKVCIDNTKKACFKIYNLPQNFSSDYWSLQYHYFGGANVYIKKDPMPLVY